MTVPATSHVFDLAGSQINYPNVEQLKMEGAVYETKSSYASYIGSFFGRKWEKT